MVEFHTGDCIEIMKQLPEKSVNCCVTSPPYFGLRDYGIEGQLGLEQTLEEYVAKLVDVFREIRRVLRDDGTVWLNLGDSYGSSSGDTYTGLKPKNLLGIPWQIAFALQTDDWYLRQDIIWHKTNPMPESVTDRCTKSHEYIFLLSKQAKYYYDHEAIKEPAKDWGTRNRKPGSAFVDGTPGRSKQSGGADANFAKRGRNKRSVWTTSTASYKRAHFAVFPPKLIEPCILAGCPKGGTVLDPFCGSGTTGVVAQQHDRNSVLCDLNPEYIELAKTRIKEEA